MKNKLLKTIIMLSKGFIYGFILQLMVLNFGFAINAKGQYKKIDEVTVKLSRNEMDLGQFFKEIHRQTPFKFSYESQDVERDISIIFNFQEGTVEEFLKEISTQSFLSFRQLNNSIDVFIKNKAKVEENNVEQQVIITGTITDGSGNPLPGASIVVEGTTTGTVTDVDGNYRIEAPEGSILIFSYVGFESKNVAVGDQSVIDVSLTEDSSSLDEVIVVGYSTVKQRDLIGSVSKISSRDITTAKAQNFTEALQGRAAGVRINNTSGTPGAPIRVDVRGVNSINSGTAPLWIVDGLPIITESLGRTANAVAQNPMASINPNDIESIEVLKDAAATAIYGSRGSNGVIIVTTKSGESGKGTVSVDYSVGVSDLTKPIESMGLANTNEWFQIVDRAFENSDRGTFQPSDLIGPNYTTPISREEAMATQSDWAGFVLRKGSFQDLNVSVSQGSEKTSIFASINYRKDKGINVGNDLSRISGRVNMNMNPLPNLKVGTRINVSYIENFRVKEGTTGPGQGAGGRGSFMAVVQSALPWFPIFDENDPSGFWNPQAGNDAIASQRQLLLDKKDQYRAMGNLNAEYTIPFINGLSLRGDVAFDIIQDNATNWADASLSLLNESFAYEGAINAKSINYNALFNFNRTYNGNIHSINAIGGTESQLISRYNREMSGRDLVGIHQQIGTANPGVLSQMNSYMDGERYLRSYFLRTNYKFLDRYLFGASIRRDGSSAFDSEFRWGTFAALSAGWILSDELFYNNLGLSKTLTFLKLRGSFGQTGNQSIPNNRNLTILNDVTSASYGPPDYISAGTTYTVGNRTITWETTNSYDIGIDFGFLEDRISGSAAYFMQDVSDMLLQVATPPSAGINNIFSNVGDMKNWGFEFNIRSVNINKNNFKWTTDINFTNNMNRVTRLTPAMEAAKGAPLYVGGRLELFKMNDYAGIDPERGVHMMWEFDRPEFEETGIVNYTGRKIPFTESNSAIYQVVMKDKSALPTYYGGVNNSFEYKGFDLSVFFYFSGGNWIYNQYERYVTNVANIYWNKKSDMLTESWEPGKTDAKYPLLHINNAAPPSTAWDPTAIDPNTELMGYWANPDVDNLVNPNASEAYDGNFDLSRYLERGDFLRLRTISLGYNFPQSWTRAVKMQNIRINLTGNNLWTLTEFTGWDPESGQSMFTPILKNYSAGVNLTF